MIVRTFKAAGDAPVFRTIASREIVSGRDNVGHSLFDTAFPAGRDDCVREGASGGFGAQAHYCVTGEGTVCVDGKCWPLIPETLVAAPACARVRIAADTQMRLCSVFAGDPQEVSAGTLVRSVDDITGTARDVFWGNGQSRRLLVRADGYGFALCQTLGNPETDSPLQYRHHFESCYYVAGSGEYVWQQGRHPIDTNGAGGTVFIMNRNDAHRMVVRDASICLSIFTPPIEGMESHDFSGSAPSSY
ncbi:ectoine synthase [Stappia sp. ES.058]|uniref:ectoine synthase n=1 Tax=Stappia sp. ES.058 TaxID=1881061 RepID=UPI00087B9A75|nr:ectoine synthase [Stappia sp. ES.058]SDU03276.1 Ectoine synthase [Stappia sp. ES.058]